MPDFEVNMIEMMLLGFLMDGEKTGYQVKKYMENSTDHFFNTGFSSIYPKFKKLEKDGLVQVSQKIQNGKLKKIYILTDDGKKSFLEWLRNKPQISRIRDEALLKVFFFDHLDQGGIKTQLEEYIVDLRDQVRALKNIKERFSYREVNQWKMKTLTFGIRYYTFLEQSYNQMLLQKDLKEAE